MGDAKHIVITGASGGIGAALAVQLGAAGHRVALAARREREPQDVAAAIASVIDHPVAEIYTNARQAAIVQNYFQDVGAFEREAAARG